MAMANPPEVLVLPRLPKFNAARRYCLSLLLFGIAFVVAGLALPAALQIVKAAAWLTAAGFLTAATMSFVRMRCINTEGAGSNKTDTSASSTEIDQTTPTRPSIALRVAAWVVARTPNAIALGEWVQALTVILCGLIAVFELTTWWRQPESVSDALTLKLIGGCVLVAAFPLLVLQRTYAGLSEEFLPEAPQLQRLLRLPLSACASVGMAMIAIAGGFAWAVQIENVIAAVVFVAAIEVVLRGVATIFVPWPSIEHRRALADSAIAGFLLRLKPPSWSSFNTTIRRQLGINLSRSWALAFVRKGALPLGAGIVVACWLFTGVTTLGINQRGVYERFGVPVAVLGPGLHIHFPWPFGVLRSVETGVVHQLPIEFVLPDRNGQLPEEEKDESVSAEAPAPREADRLWDDAHPYEGSYLIASEENDRQSFQLVNVDMAVVYQIGNSDEAARDAAYRVADAEAFIQALSGQILVRYLSQHQLLELLGESREGLSADFQARLQQELDKFATGVEILTISIEAIHPPPGAANAYHDVQAAQIRAGTHVAESHGSAVRSQEQSQQLALGERNKAAAVAAELVGQAQTASVLFDGDRRAYAKDSEAFLLERWLDSLTKALGKSDVLIMDHRLKGQEAPTLDMRGLTAPPYDRLNQRE
jgi:regulator of protease activity HflC (stomatin/prohibitin superfamily)